MDNSECTNVSRKKKKGSETLKLPIGGFVKKKSLNYRTCKYNRVFYRTLGVEGEASHPFILFPFFSLMKN